MTTAVACVVLGAAGTARAGEPSGQGRLTAGAAALLLEGRVTAAELARWSELLSDERPSSRATAARLASVSGAAPLVPALVSALDKEADPVAAREMMIALGRIAPPGAADEALFAAAGRSSGALDGALARSLALRGGSGVPLVPRLAKLALDRSDWEAYFAWATRDGREMLDPAAAAALSTGEVDAWAAVLALARATGLAVDDATLARSLQDPSGRVREESYWHLSTSRHPAPAEGTALAAAFAAAPEARGGGGGLAGLAYEILGRSFGRTGLDRTALIESLDAEERARLPRELPVLQQLRGAEREAYGRAAFGDPDAVKRRTRDAREDSPSYPALRGRPVIVRTASDIPSHLVEEVLAAAGCKVEGSDWAVLEVQYDGGGQVERLGMPPMKDLSNECRRAARVLLLSALVPGDRPPRPGGTDVLLLPLTAPFLSCLAQDQPTRVPRARRAGGKIVEPRKIRHVAPVYPLTASTQRRQGVVVLETVLSPNGCVRSAEVLRGVSADLDGAALRAVAQWAYTPTLLDGVPVVMTVTVNFKLN